MRCIHYVQHTEFCAAGLYSSRTWTADDDAAAAAETPFAASATLLHTFFLLP